MTDPASTGTPWLVIRTPRPAAEMRLICLPYAGGNAGAFDTWGARLPTNIEVCAVQYPGRRERLHEPAPRRMIQLLSGLEKGLDGHIDRPFVLFGNSFGALVAFELARRLRRRGRRLPIRLVVSSAQAPHRGAGLPDFARMTDDRLIDELIELGTMPPEVRRHPSLAAAALPAVRADFELARSYHYRPDGVGTVPLAMPIDAITGAADRNVPESSLADWGELTTAVLRTFVLPGGHDLLTRDSDEILGRMVDSCQHAMTDSGCRTDPVPSPYRPSAGTSAGEPL